MEAFEHFQNTENLRLEELNSYEIMETDPEEIFDHLTTFAARVCKTPIALLSFIDDKRQWVKSSFGLSLSEIPRSASPCNQTIAGNGVHEISYQKEGGENLLGDYFKGMNLAHYTGVPIATQKGLNIGALCVLDYRPRVIPKKVINSLFFISQEISEILSMRKTYQENLKKITHLKKSSHKFKEEFLEEELNEAKIKAIAELSAGVIYRLKPFIHSTTRILERLEAVKSYEHPSEDIKLVGHALRRTITTVDVLSRFIHAQHEKWMRPLYFQEILLRALAEIEQKISQKNIYLQTFLGPQIWGVGNSHQLLESLCAILNNAIEAVEEAEEKKITIEMKEENHKAVIFVSDTGIGVKDKIKPFIFNPLFSSKKQQGLGVGLSIAKAFSRRHKGDVELVRDHSPTVFKMWIPIPS